MADLSEFRRELSLILIKDYKDKLGYFYCALNCFEQPEGFPVKINIHDNHRKQREDQHNKACFDAVCDCLSEKDQSKAWWIIQLKRTEQEWLDWWNNKRQGMLLIPSTLMA